MKFEVLNPFTGIIEVFETRELAEEKLTQTHQQFIAQDDDRFTICQEIVTGNDTTWINVDFNTAQEEGMYCVFNTTIGQYERVNGLSNALNRRTQIKDLVFNSMCFVTEVKETPQVEVSGVINV